jgi:hypothetical protein
MQRTAQQEESKVKWQRTKLLPLDLTPSKDAVLKEQFMKTAGLSRDFADVVK